MVIVLQYTRTLPSPYDPASISSSTLKCTDRMKLRCNWLGALTLSVQDVWFVLQFKNKEIIDHGCTKSGDSFFSGRTLVSEFMSKLKNKIITNQSIDSTGRRGHHFEENYHFVPGLFLTSRYRYAERFLFSSASFYKTFNYMYMHVFYSFIKLCFKREVLKN